ncbi:ABC transporter permease [Herbiconiux sp. KACC 21604]|uniref:ABC transporter permease n=1 Tax=unclassified Herbiconiux TaxID=2618217 RepID=UPI0014909438|nr:ABC transporter permease [Herbiconiux sp. SALV-R1]QJU55373.1 ABC transporter permease [Herbiconiux sp. SALV-R1]WPO86544.1 ABC transporter permease [Herbiconiux sp. KACC 21604]
MSTATPTRSADAPTPRDPRAGRPKQPSIAQGTWLVAQREISMRLRSKAFLVSTGILMLAILASIVIGGIFSATVSATKVAVVSSTASVTEAAAASGALDVTTADSPEAAAALVEDGTVEAAVVPAGSVKGGTLSAAGGTDAAAGTAANGTDAEPGTTASGTDSPSGTPASATLDYDIVALDSAPTSLVQLLSASPQVVLLDPSDDADWFITYIIGIAFGVVFFMSAVTFGTTIAQSVVEEKQTRVVEILLSTISARELMAGKVVGNSILAFGQIAIIAAISALGLTITGQSGLLGLLGPAIAWFVVFFVFGFVLIAALFAATAALVSRQEDVASVTSPVTMLVMIPYFLVIFFNSNELVMGIMSYVPFSAPIGMPLRLFLGDAAWWEPLVSLVILLATTAVVVVIGSRIYANSLLRTGARVKLLEALRG